MAHSAAYEDVTGIIHRDARIMALSDLEALLDSLEKKNLITSREHDELLELGRKLELHGNSQTRVDNLSRLK